jgi:hypothetical protein
MDAPVSEHAASGDAIEGEHAQRRATTECGQRIAAGSIGSRED